MPVLSSASVRNVMLGSTKAKKVYLGTKLVWEADQGPAALYSGTGWYKATDTGIVFCKGIPSRQTYSFTGDTRVYVSVHTVADATLYAERAATSNMVNMDRVFFATDTNPDIRHWDVSNVTSMVEMFYFAFEFNQDLSKWNVSKVTNMSRMFDAAGKFNQNITSWNVSNVTNMSGMFGNTTVFNQNISGWNVSKVTDMSSMFTYAKVFNQNISSWNVSNVTNMKSMFNNAAVFNQNISSWKVNKVTDMSFMFTHAYVFNQNLSKWCVTLIKTKPTNFEYLSGLAAANFPRWGTCPAG